MIIVCILHLQPFSLGPATIEVLNNHIWPVASILDSTVLDHISSYAFALKEKYVNICYGLWDILLLA